MIIYPYLSKRIGYLCEECDILLTPLHLHLHLHYLHPPRPKKCSSLLNVTKLPVQHVLSVKCIQIDFCEVSWHYGRLHFEEYLNQTEKKLLNICTLSKLSCTLAPSEVVSVVSSLTSCFSILYARKKRLQSIFNQRHQLGLLEANNLQKTISICKKGISLQMIMYDLNNFLVTLPPWI